jgi:16S rRNA (guanine527-N7)-methyltransferase
MERAKTDLLLRTGLEELRLDANPLVLEAFATLAELIVEWGGRLNLTGYRDVETVVRRSILDAAALSTVLPAWSGLADLGSGAGLPGLPLAILAPDARVLLVEARERRNHFQRHAIRTVAIRNARAIRGRFEEIDPERCELVIAQAVAPHATLVSAMMRWALQGGRLAVPLGAEGPAPEPRPGLANTAVVHYQVPLGGPRRRLWIAEVL